MRSFNTCCISHGVFGSRVQTGVQMKDGLTQVNSAIALITRLGRKPGDLRVTEVSADQGGPLCGGDA